MYSLLLQEFELIFNNSQTQW